LAYSGANMQLAPVPPIHVTVVAPEHPWYAQWDFWVSVFTLFLVIATLLLVRQTRKVWQRSDLAIGELSKHAENAAASSKDSADAARKSADAAVRGVELSQESMQRSLRAYVIVEGIEILSRITNEIPSGINVCAMNTGQTPARGLELFYEFSILKAFPTSMNTKGKATLSQSDIGRDQRRKWLAKQEYTQSDIQEISSGTSFLMAYGCVRYYDMFLDEPRHTYFSYAWDANHRYFYPAGPMNTLS
jgi:hypothetical protein